MTASFQIWVIHPDLPPVRVIGDGDESAAFEKARAIIGNWVDLTHVVFLGRRCHMAVDDEGALKDLPINDAATRLYHAACIPGTTWPIRGTAVVFDGELP
jgi:hypothetical protein